MTGLTAESSRVQWTVQGCGRADWTTGLTYKESSSSGLVHTPTAGLDLDPSPIPTGAWS
jgi:hypothetical protein